MDGIDILKTVKRDNPDDSRRHHLGPRQHRDRGRRDQAGRLRLHRKALQHRPAHGRGGAGDGNLAPAAREHRASPPRRAAAMIGTSAAFRRSSPTSTRLRERTAGSCCRARPGPARKWRRATSTPTPTVRRSLHHRAPPPSSPNGWRRCSSAAKAPSAAWNRASWNGRMAAWSLRRSRRHAARHAVEDPARADRTAVPARRRRRRRAGRPRHLLDHPRPQGEIAAGRFRQELYDRLNVVPIAVPPRGAARGHSRTGPPFHRRVHTTQGLPSRT